MPCWRSGLTHYPLKVTFTGSNPVQGTKTDKHQQFIVGFLFLYRKMLIFVKKIQILTLLFFARY